VVLSHYYFVYGAAFGGCFLPNKSFAPANTESAESTNTIRIALDAIGFIF
jgi:hypothetical protein